MTTSVRRPLRWSKKTDLLVRYVAYRCRPSLQSELGRWLEESTRFSAFLTANQDKIRKKLTITEDEESRLDVRSELLVAFLLLADRRFELAFEAYGARRLGPDLSVSYRANQRFNLEVTRLRTRAGSPAVSGNRAPQPTPEVAARLANVITGKLRQLPGEVANVLVMTARGLSLPEENLAAAVRLLKTHTDQKDDAFFSRRGLRNARDFYARFLHLSGVFVVDEVGGNSRAVFAANREARHPLSAEAAAALSACLRLPDAGAVPDI